MVSALAYVEESPLIAKTPVDLDADDKHQKELTPVDLPNGALACLFDQVSVGKGKRVLEFNSEFKYFEEDPAAWRLAATHPVLRDFYLDEYVVDVTIRSAALLPEDFFGWLFLNIGDVYPRLFENSMLSKLTLENVRELRPGKFDLELNHLLRRGVQSNELSSRNRVPVLQRVKDLAIIRPNSLSDFALKAIPVSFPNVTNFAFKDGYYGILRFSAFLSDICTVWKSSLKCLNLSGVHGVDSNLEWCFQQVGNLQALEELDLSNWERDYFSPSSLKLSNIAPLVALKDLKRLHLRYCRVDEESLGTVLMEMSVLEELNVMNSNVSPKISAKLPPSVLTFSAGFHRAPRVSSRDPDDYQEPVLCLSPNSLPRLQKLRWGCWPSDRQGWKSLGPVAKQLTALDVWGPEYGESDYEILATSTELKYLGLHNGAMTSRLAKYVNSLEKLERLELDCTGRPGAVRIVRKITNGRALASGVLRTLLLRNVKRGSSMKQIKDVVGILNTKYPALSVIVREKTEHLLEREHNSEGEEWL